MIGVGIFEVFAPMLVGDLELAVDLVGVVNLSRDIRILSVGHGHGISGGCARSGCLNLICNLTVHLFSQVYKNELVISELLESIHSIDIEY